MGSISVYIYYLVMLLHIQNTITKTWLNQLNRIKPWLKYFTGSLFGPVFETLLWTIGAKKIDRTEKKKSYISVASADLERIHESPKLWLIFISRPPLLNLKKVVYQSLFELLRDHVDNHLEEIYKSIKCFELYQFMKDIVLKLKLVFLTTITCENESLYTLCCFPLNQEVYKTNLLFLKITTAENELGSVVVKFTHNVISLLFPNLVMTMSCCVL